MPVSVIDTNVLVVANGQAGDAADPECELLCLQYLRDVVEKGVIGLDSLDLILFEYKANIDQRKPMKAGAAFLVALFNFEVDRHTVSITEHETREYREFPDDPKLLTFDKSDRKFVAVALASGHHRLGTATDSDFWHAKFALAQNGVSLDFVCEHLHES